MSNYKLATLVSRRDRTFHPKGPHVIRGCTAPPEYECNPRLGSVFVGIKTCFITKYAYFRGIRGIRMYVCIHVDTQVVVVFNHNVPVSVVCQLKFNGVCTCGQRVRAIPGLV